MRRLFLLMLFSLSYGRTSLATTDHDLLVCSGLVSLRSPLLMSLTEPGNAIIDSAIEQIEALGGRPTSDIYDLHKQLVPLFLRTGLRWSEISAIATPRGYENYLATIPVSNHLTVDVLSFLSTVIGQNHKLAGDITSHELAVLFLKQFKAALNPPLE